MTIEVSRCYECPMCYVVDRNALCERTQRVIPTKNRIDGPLPGFCPLLKESLVVKRKSEIEEL